MKKTKSLLIIMLFFFGGNRNAGAEVSVYPAPKGVKSSAKYHVSVVQNEKTFPSFVYYSTPLDNDADNAGKIRNEVVSGINRNPLLREFYFGGKEKPLDTEQSVAWTCFSFSENVKVRISFQQGKIETFKILPSSAGIEGSVEGSYLTFTLNEPKKLAIVINGDYLNPLFLFADAPEVGVPDKKAPGTVYREGSLLSARDAASFQNRKSAMRINLKSASDLYIRATLSLFYVVNSTKIYL